MSASTTSPSACCPVCGGVRDGSLPAGLCARCLLAAALEPEPRPDEYDLSSSGEHSGSCARSEQFVGRYRLLDEISRGGVGVVHRVWQADLKREVALKMLLPARLASQDALDRFRREAELMAGLDHPGILPVYEVGSQEGLPYFSMKLAEGGNLAQRIPALRGQFRECARLVALIARAVGYAHGRGVLHRDLKPSNIVFDASNQPLVMDFGLARLLEQDSSLTGIDALIGTPRYVAPEVATTAGACLTAAADVYGLGAILYEMLSGDAPYAELTPLEILQQMAARRLRRPRELDAAIPKELEAVCLRCLEKRPQDRYRSADDVALALEDWLAGSQPQHLLLRWLGARLILPSRRRRAGRIAAVMVAAGLIVAGAWYVSRETIPALDPAIATRTVALLPSALRMATPAERETARQLAMHLRLPPNLRLLPFEATLAAATSKSFPKDIRDVGALLGALVVVDVKALPGAQRFAVRADDDLREERLYEATFVLADAPGVARKLGEALAQRRQRPTAESRLSRRELGSLVRAVTLLRTPGKGTDETAATALKEVIAKAPGSALAHAWLAYAYIQHGGESFWLDSAIDEAARAQRMDPGLGLALKQLGMAYYYKSWFTRATKAYEQARALGSLYVESKLCLLYYETGRFDDSYRACRLRQRFEPDDAVTQGIMANTLFTVGENDAGEQAMRLVMGSEPDAGQRLLKEAEIAMYRHAAARCRKLAGSIAPATYDGYFTAAGLIRTCAVQQGDFAAALATMVNTRYVYANQAGSANGNHPALKEAILLAQLQRNDKVPALLTEARQGLQAAIDSNSEFPTVWLRMAAAQRLAGEVDAAYATLDRAFALGLTVNNRNRSDVEFLPFRGDARFAALRLKSAAYVAQQRKQVADQLSQNSVVSIAKTTSPD